MRSPSVRVGYEGEKAFARAYLAPKVQSGVFEQRINDPDVLPDAIGIMLDTMVDEDDRDRRELWAWQIEDQIKIIRRGPGRPPREANQKQVIQDAVEAVVQRFGLNKHRGPATRHVESACRIVAWALRDLGIHDMTEGKVTEIVLNRSPRRRSKRFARC
jgi:hypothetical protein